MMGWQDGSEGKMLHANSGDLSAILRTYMLEGENRIQQIVTGLPYMCHNMGVHTMDKCNFMKTPVGRDCLLISRQPRPK